MSDRHFKPFLLIIALIAHSALARAQEPGAIVGEATLVIGSASFVSADGKLRAVERGGVVRLGDRIETQPGGHVHLKFVDGGRISVRPSSRLQVENYSHVSQQPELGAIKFRLDEGVVRSITGAWGEAARDRFRLNTPVAAIGVKGTDFVVRATLDTTAAAVYTGAITLASMTAPCANSLGPCINGSEKVLSEDMKGQMLELTRQQSSPRLVPAIDLMAAAARAQFVELAKAEKKANAEPAQSELVINKALVSEERAQDAVDSVKVVNLLPAKVTDLHWVRYPWAPVMIDDNYSHSFDAALKQGRASLGGNGAYTLLRDVPAAGPAFQPADAAVQFRLASSAASLVKQDGSVAERVRVTDAMFNVDFSRSAFATELKLSGNQTGQETITAAGVVRPNGTLLVDSGNSYLLGGFSANGNEGAYLFQKAVAAGSLMGTTLWGR